MEYIGQKVKIGVMDMEHDLNIALMAVVVSMSKLLQNLLQKNAPNVIAAHLPPATHLPPELST